MWFLVPPSTPFLWRTKFILSFLADNDQLDWNGRHTVCSICRCACTSNKWTNRNSAFHSYLRNAFPPVYPIWPLLISIQCSVDVDLNFTSPLALLDCLAFTLFIPPALIAWLLLSLTDNSWLPSSFRELCGKALCQDLITAALLPLGTT